MKVRILVLMAVVALASVARADLYDTFDVGTAQWSVVAYPFRDYVADPATMPATFDPTFGNPAGSLRIGDVYPETGVAAPAAYLGDDSACYGLTLSYDLYVRYVDAGAVYPAVVLNGATTSVYYDAPAPAVDTWEHRAIILTEAGWKVSGTGVPVDEGTFRSILADLHGLYIYTEWHTGDDDTNLDNVFLQGAVIGVPDAAPRAVVLRPCFPNPFNPRTTLRFELANPGFARLQILDVSGRLVSTLLAQPCAAGPGEVTWDGCDAAGRPVASGTYIGCLEVAGRRSSQRLVLTR